MNDDCFNELIQDLLVSEHDDRVLASVYLEAFLPRWERRCLKSYSQMDSFAAACSKPTILLLLLMHFIVGARRLVQHLGLSTHSQTIIATERTLARAVASGIIDTATLASAIDKHSILKLGTTNPYSESMYLIHMKGQQRERETERIANECLARADEWSPDVAQMSSRAKNSSRRERGLSLFSDVEVARVTGEVVDRAETPFSDPIKLSTDSVYLIRKTPIDPTREQSPSLQSKLSLLNPGSFFVRRKNSADAGAQSAMQGGIPMQRSESAKDEPKRKWYQRKPSQNSASKPVQSYSPLMYSADSVAQRMSPSESFRRLPMDISMQRSQSNDSPGFAHSQFHLYQPMPYTQRRPSADSQSTPPLQPRKQSIDPLSPLLSLGINKRLIVSPAAREQDGERDNKSSTSYESKASGSYKSDGMYEYRRKASFAGGTVLGSLTETRMDNIQFQIDDSGTRRADTAPSGGVRRGSAEALLQELQEEIESMHFDDV